MVDVRALGRKEGREHRKLVVDRALKSAEQDNEGFYRKLRARFDRRARASAPLGCLTSHLFRPRNLSACIRGMLHAPQLVRQSLLLGASEAAKAGARLLNPGRGGQRGAVRQELHGSNEGMQALRACLFCMCRVGIEMSRVEVRFEGLRVDADVFVGGRAMPTVLNSVRNFVEVLHYPFLITFIFTSDSFSTPASCGNKLPAPPPHLLSAVTSLHSSSSSIMTVLRGNAMDGRAACVHACEGGGHCSTIVTFVTYLYALCRGSCSARASCAPTSASSRSSAASAARSSRCGPK